MEKKTAGIKPENRELYRLFSEEFYMQLTDEIIEDIKNAVAASISTLLVEQWVKELQEIKKAVKWMWENLHLPHTSDHFNVPANCIQSIENLETSLSTGSTGEEWIRVEDRLPDPHIFVLVTLQTLHDSWVEVAGFGTITFQLPGRGRTAHVTHWRPLPTPPQSPNKQ